MLTPDLRRNIILNAEGSVLSMCGQSGPEAAAEIARGQIDGYVNALIRIDGAETTARYVFVLGDRVAGGLRAPTDFRVPEPPKVIEPAPPSPPTIPEPARRSLWWYWAHGVISGVALSYIAAWFIPRF